MHVLVHLAGNLCITTDGRRHHALAIHNLT